MKITPKWYLEYLVHLSFWIPANTLPFYICRFIIIIIWLKTTYIIFGSYGDHQWTWYTVSVIGGEVNAFLKYGTTKYGFLSWKDKVWFEDLFSFKWAFFSSQSDWIEVMTTLQTIEGKQNTRQDWLATEIKVRKNLKLSNCQELRKVRGKTRGKMAIWKKKNTWHKTDEGT